MNNLILGADISQIPQQEYEGAHYSLHGEPMDCLQILRQQGLNAVRIKVWNDPGNPDFFPANQGHACRFNSPDRVIELAQRAAALGFRILIDFHYSDWWADPQKQFIPHAWQGLTLNAIADQLYQFTYEVLWQLRQRQIQIDWVQVGNEISHGMLWPVAFLPGHWPELAVLLQRGAAAVKDANSSTRVVFHLDAGADQSLYRKWFNEVVGRKIPFDIIGLSFYPCWHGSMKLLKANLNSLAECYGKALMVVETAYPRMLDIHRNYQWIIQHCGEEPYPASVEGQGQFLQALLRTVDAVSGGLGQGVFYWEPAMIPTPLTDCQNTAWENVTLFDSSGAALPSLAQFGRGPHV